MLSIAIAEDNAEEREKLKKQVIQLGYTLQIVAVNGYDLLEQLQVLPTQKLPQILLLDIKMPRINGLLVTMYCAFKYPSIKVIGISSHTNEQLVTQVITEGASAFITKYFLTPSSIVYTDNYGDANLLQLAINAVQKGELFIDKLLVNYPENIQRTISTNTIIQKKYAQLKPKHREFIILNAAGLSLNEVALLMHISKHTIKDYNTVLCKMFAVDNHHQLVHACFELGIVKLAVYFDNSINN
ncbi:MAG: response regulator [Chitinophagaceae bacterium]